MTEYYAVIIYPHKGVDFVHADLETMEEIDTREHDSCDSHTFGDIHGDYYLVVYEKKDKKKRREKK